jgi:cobaltochelatase CobN
VLRVVTTADTEILAVARAVERLPADFPEVRCASAAELEDLDAFARGARVVLCRVLGGRRGWPRFDELQRICAAQRIPLLALGGEASPDAEMTALSTAPAGAVAQAGEYLRHGDVHNVEQLLRFLADSFLLEGFGFDPPRDVADFGAYLPGRPDSSLDEVLAACDPERPTIGICFYRSHWLSGNTLFVDELCAAIDDAGGNALPVWSYSLRAGMGEDVRAVELLRDHVDAVLVTMLAAGSASAAEAWDGWTTDALGRLGVPVLQAVCATTSREAWLASDAGLSPLDAATQVAIPEFDGRLLAGVISFKERDRSGTRIGAPVPRYVPDRERCARAARLAVRHARLRRTPASRRRVGIVLTSFPTKHARVGMAVGLDTPASALALLDALHRDGMHVEHDLAEGDALMHSLIAAGGHDPDFLTEAQLADAPLRMPISEYLGWYAGLPAAFRESVEGRWGPPPGDQYVDGDDFVIAGLELGNVVVTIQPPRGWGEDPVAIYHDPELPPTHHYLACYRWLDSVWRADALVHLGKHGTLEWLPGKTLGLSEACAPDAALGDLPLVYPFVVNDPGEGVQAKRRAHAVIVDHLVPPMMRAGTYDELAELETLLDDYARLETLDPAKLPALAARIWAAIERANLHSDLALDERPDDLGALVEHIDGYLCEVKDIQVKDGLHVLGLVPSGEQLRGLVAALLGLDVRGVRALRAAIAADFGLDEAALRDGPAAPAPPAASLVTRFPGPTRNAADLLDRLEDAQERLLEALDADAWDAGRVEANAHRVLGRRAPEVVRTLRFAAAEVIPRLRATASELGAVVDAVNGRPVAAGPSGSPTRGRLDVLPTGRNFYSVDPRAIPSELAWEVGQRLADALLERYRAENGELPRMVGLVAWGTSAMRTEGDDVAEILALMGVRPRWSAESRRVTGVDPIPLDELGRPRIDVTVRISGFFRDAFPHIVRLLDEAVELVAGLDEPDEQNFVAAHARADAQLLANEVAAGDAWRTATTRVFGSRPGTYGAGLLQLLDSGDWRDTGDLAAVYEAWGGFAYGRGQDGARASAAMRACYGRIDLAVKNVDNREHDILDSDDYFQYLGGMVAAVGAIRGDEPAAFVGDSADPARPAARTLAEETRRVFRARVANPRWIASMIRHGFKGAAELSATVDYLFGFDATAGVAEDWMYEQVAARYLLDEDIAAFMSASNPWAAQAIAGRLLEAAARGMWSEPPPDTLDRLRDRFLALDGELEEVS